jgi:hypothetical protein
MRMAGVVVAVAVAVAVVAAVVVGGCRLRPGCVVAREPEVLHARVRTRSAYARAACRRTACSLLCRWHSSAFR